MRKMLNALKQNPKLKPIYKNSYKLFKVFLRLLRKKIVLALIFTLSFTYCLVSLVRQKSNSKSIDGNLEDYETNVDIDHLQHIIRQSHRLNDNYLKDNNSLDLDINSNDIDLNNNDIKELTIDKSIGSELKCRNSIQGKVLIADDRGFVCHRKDVLLSGCCDSNSVNTKLYLCETCQSNGCCAIYEYCISCCLNPSKKPLLTKIVGQKTSETFNVLMASITDHFELCLTKCRTSSASVQHENSYRDPKAKHCFGENTENLN